MAIDPSQIQNNYPNPLDEFRSYSYQFVLTLANTTTAISSQIGDPKTGNSPVLNAVLNANAPGAAFSVGGGETAYLVADTRRFSAYQITDLTMDHIYGTGHVNNPSVPTNSTHMKLVDSTGLSFFNMLIDLFRNKLQSTRASAFFLLTILFVGHKADGTTETISTCFIPLMMLTMEFEVTGIGAVFEIDFMEMEGGPKPGAPLELMNGLGQVTKITTNGATATIGGLTNELERQLNIQSLDFYQKYRNAATQAVSGQKLGKLVQYMITVPDAWSAFTCGLAGKAQNVEQIFKAAKYVPPDNTVSAADQEATITSTSKDVQLSFSHNSSITDAVKIILESSVDFLKLASEDKRKAGQAVTFKTIMTVTSDANSYIVHVDVFPYNMPKLNTSASNATVTPSQNTNIGNSSGIKNLITVDYLFSGLNSEVLDLKIKYLPESAIALDTSVNIGHSRLTSNAEAGQKTSDQDTASKNRAATSTSFSPDIRSGDPVFFSLKSKEQLDNAVRHKDVAATPAQAQDAFKARQEHTQSIAYLHFLSSISTDITLRGNPNLIKKYADRNCRGGVPPHTTTIQAPAATPNSSTSKAEDVYQSSIASSLASGKAQYYAQYVKPRIDSFTTSQGAGDALLTGPDVSVLPLFCQVNMYAPNIDYTTGQTVSGGNPYTNEFFYNGAYMVLFLNTTFGDGQFQHTLSMIPYDVSSITTQNDAPSTPTTKTY